MNESSMIIVCKTECGETVEIEVEEFTSFDGKHCLGVVDGELASITIDMPETKQ